MKLQLISLALISAFASSSMASANNVEGMTVTTVVDNKDDKENDHRATALLSAITATRSYNVAGDKATLGYTHCTSRDLSDGVVMSDCAVDDKPGVYGTQAQALFKALEEAGVKPVTHSEHKGFASITVDGVECTSQNEGSEAVVVCDIQIYKK